MKTVNLDPEHQLDVTRGRKSTLRSGSSGITVRDSTTTGYQIWDVTVIGGTWTVNDDGTAILIISGSGVTTPGDVTPDNSTAQTVADEVDHEAFPGAAWLDDPTATVHGVGDRFIIVYRRATSHLTNGRTVAKIATITSTTPWAYTLGSMFTIEDIADDVRVDDAVSVLDIGGGDYRAVILCREYDGTANHAPHVHICDDSSATMTSASTWARHDIAYSSGANQNLGSGRVIQLQNGQYACAAYHITGATQTTAIIKTSDITDWSSPTIVNIAAGYNEIDIEQVEDGTLHANMRNVANTHIYGTASTDNGATWSTPVQQFAGTHFPTWRVLTSGMGMILYASTVGLLYDAAFRQTDSGVTNTGWGAETIYEASDALTAFNYGTILQLDDNNVLVVFAMEAGGIPDPTNSDVYSRVFGDSSVLGSNIFALDDLSDVTILAAQENDTLRYINGRWRNDNRRWEPVTDNPGSGPELVWDGDDLVYHWTEY